MLRVLRDILIERPLVIETSLSDTKLSKENKEELVKVLGELGYGFDSYTSYAVTDKARVDKPANYAVIPNQYFVFASKMHEFATELFKYFEIYERLRPHAAKLVGNENHIVNQINSDPTIKKEFKNIDDILPFAQFLDKENSEYRLGSKRLINDQGAPRGSKDCFSSVILKEINLPDASSSIFGRLVYDLCVNPLVYENLVQAYSGTKTFSSPDNWTVEFSSSTIRGFIQGIFDYLFRNKIENNLLQSLTDTNGTSGKLYKELELDDRKIYRLFMESQVLLNEQDLISGKGSRYFLKPFEHEGKYLYLTNQWADNSDISKNSRDIIAFSFIFNELYSNLKITKENDTYKLVVHKRPDFLTEFLPKPFILLAGISGTGKTRFVREQAIAHKVGDINFCQIPVRPDWHEPSDLLGYISRISGTKYIATKALKFIIDAWRVVAPNADKEGMGYLDLSVAPYWLCLDEMNLAPVEQYFADYLSVLESRKFENGKYTCEPLLTQSNFQMDIKSLRTDLGISDDEDGLWEYFSHHGIPLPPNLIVAGTVNMDETTHGFSRKVIDRAFTLDFGEFFPNDYQKFFSGQELPKTFTYSQLTHASQKDLINTFDVDGAKTVAFLESINKVLKQTPFELAYRALNELLLHVACFSPQNEKELQAVWDDFLMTKVLPRIDGDDDKLRLVHKGEPANLLEVLAVLLKSNLNEIWAEGKIRKDFFRNTQYDIPCRSLTKIEWMKNRLEANTFTSFWP
jgi:hypothetical protein